MNSGPVGEAYCDVSSSMSVAVDSMDIMAFVQRQRIGADAHSSISISRLIAACESRRMNTSAQAGQSCRRPFPEAFQFHLEVNLTNQPADQEQENDSSQLSMTFHHRTSNLTHLVSVLAKMRLGVRREEWMSCCWQLCSSQAGFVQLSLTSSFTSEDLNCH